MAKAVTVNQIRNVPFALALAFACAWMLDPSAAIPAGFASLVSFSQYPHLLVTSLAFGVLALFHRQTSTFLSSKAFVVASCSLCFLGFFGAWACSLQPETSREFYLRLSLRNGALPSLSAHLVPQGACGAPPRRLPFNAHCLAVFCRHTAGTLHFASATCHILYCAPRNRPLPHEKDLYCALARKPYGYFASEEAGKIEPRSFFPIARLLLIYSLIIFTIQTLQALPPRP